MSLPRISRLENCFQGAAMFVCIVNGITGQRGPYRYTNYLHNTYILQINSLRYYLTLR